MAAAQRHVDAEVAVITILFLTRCKGDAIEFICSYRCLHQELVETPIKYKMKLVQAYKLIISRFRGVRLREATLCVRGRKEADVNSEADEEEVRKNCPGWKGLQDSGDLTPAMPVSRSEA